MLHLRSIISIAASLLLAGCQTVAQKKMMAMNVEATNINTRAQACYEGVRRDKKYLVVGHKLYLNPQNSPSLAVMSNPDLANDAEVEALHSIYQLSQPCRRIEIEAASKVHPLFAGFYANLYSQYDGVTLGLVNRSLTWGQANHKLQEVAAWRVTEETNMNRIIKAEMELSHEAEIAQRQIIAQSIAQWSYQQQALANQRAMINTMNQPHHTITNCDWFGRSLSCRSF